jgi:hypothetical protein
VFWQPKFAPEKRALPRICIVAYDPVRAFAKGITSDFNSVGERSLDEPQPEMKKLAAGLGVTMTL